VRNDIASVGQVFRQFRQTLDTQVKFAPLRTIDVLVSDTPQQSGQRPAAQKTTKRNETWAQKRQANNVCKMGQKTGLQQIEKLKNHLLCLF